ncbi:MAG TPA: cupin domain-containing protein [Kofleriaceae bacterium]|nr:cupin domain-containing protein [Kofleriaceae bacterium]
MNVNRLLLSIGLVSVTTLAACKKDKKAEPQATAGSAAAGSAAAGSAAGSAETPPPKPPEATNTTDSELAGGGVMLNLEEHTWKPIGSLPKGAEMAVLEGTPPFAAPKAFTILLKFPNKYTIPPHTHLVTERVTVLSGALLFGHGEKYDKSKTKELTAGGIVMVPADHAHFVTTTKETVVQLQGVGPWGIFYIDPKDDPRQPPPEKPASVDHPTDSEIQPTEQNVADTKWAPAPSSLPPGAEIAVLEGAPPFGAGKSFVMRLKFPAGYKIPVHHHLVTERVTVLSGALKFGMGDKWEDAAMKSMKAGGEILMPREHKHFVQADGETIVQLQGVGPWGIVYANPDEDPRNAKK